MPALSQGRFAFDNPIAYQHPPQGGGELDAEGSVVQWADEVQLLQTTIIRSVVWWGGESNARQTSSGEFSLTLYADDAGRPGAVISEFALGVVRGAATGSTFGNSIPEIRYVGTLRQPFTFTNASRYWMSINNPPAYTWGWEMSDTGNGAFVRVQQQQWKPTKFNAAFALSTEITEIPTSTWGS